MLTPFKSGYTYPNGQDIMAVAFPDGEGLPDRPGVLTRERDGLLVLLVRTDRESEDLVALQSAVQQSLRRLYDHRGNWEEDWREFSDPEKAEGWNLTRFYCVDCGFRADPYPPLNPAEHAPDCPAIVGACQGEVVPSVRHESLPKTLAAFGRNEERGVVHPNELRARAGRSALCTLQTA